MSEYFRRCRFNSIKSGSKKLACAFLGLTLPITTFYAFVKMNQKLNKGLEECQNGLIELVLPINLNWAVLHRWIDIYIYWVSRCW